MKNLARKALLYLSLFSLLSCSGREDLVQNFNPYIHDPVYIIPGGVHEARHSAYRPFHDASLGFSVMFDSTAIYKTNDPGNQEDINKLYGFSDNNGHHHEFSARFGWNWARDSLRLYAYVYNEGLRESKEISAIGIGTYYDCRISISASRYVFQMNDRILFMPRKSEGDSARGYMLFPYFGGDEPAPHDIRITIIPAIH